MDVSPLQSYVARLKDEKAALERLLKQLKTENVSENGIDDTDEKAALERLLKQLKTENVSENGIDDTDAWIEQVTVRLAAIDTVLKALEEV